MIESEGAAAAEKPRVKIDAWFIGNRYWGISSAKSYLHGLAKNHPTLGQKWINSSEIIRDDSQKPNREVETLNTVYELGISFAALSEAQRGLSKDQPQVQAKAA